MSAFTRPPKKSSGAGPIPAGATTSASIPAGATTVGGAIPPPPNPAIFTTGPVKGITASSDLVEQNANVFRNALNNLYRTKPSYTSGDFINMLHNQCNYPHTNQLISLSELVVIVPRIGNTPTALQHKAPLMMNVLPYILYECNLTGAEATLMMGAFIGLDFFTAFPWNSWSPNATNELKSFYSTPTRINKFQDGILNTNYIGKIVHRFRNSNRRPNAYNVNKIPLTDDAVINEIAQKVVLN